MSTTPSQVVMRQAVEPWFYTYCLLAFTTTGIVPIMVPLLVAGQGHPATEVGVILSATGAGMLTSPLWGMLASRYHCYRALGSGGALLVCATILGLATCRMLDLWILLMFVLGCGVSASFTVSNLLILSNHPEHEVDARIGWLQTIVTLGTVAGLAAAGFLGDMSAATGMVMGAVTSGAAALLAVTTMRSGWKTPSQRVMKLVKRSGPLLVSQVLVRGKVNLPREEHTRPDPGPTRRLWLLVAAWVCANLGMNGFTGLYPLLMEHEFGVSVRAASLVLSASTGISALLYVKSSRMTHLQGGRRVLLLGLSIRGLALAGVLFLGRAGIHSLVLTLVGVAVMVTPLLGVSSTIFAAQLASDKGVGLGFYNGAGALAGLLGPVIAGYLADSYGYSYVTVFALTGEALALGLTTFLPGKETVEAL